MIKNIMIIRNIVIYNEHHDRYYSSEKGIILVEFTNGEKATLDLDSMCDISDSDYLKVIIDKKTSECEYLFKNIMYDTKRLKELAGK